MLRFAGLCAALVVLSLGAPARAQQDPCQPRDGFSTCFAADNLWLHPGGGRWLAAAPTQTADEDTAGFGFAVGYLHRPVGLRVASADPDGTTIYAVENVLTATVLASLGVTDRLQLQLVAPFVMWQRGASKADVIGSDDRLPRSAIGDLRFGASYSVLKRPMGADGPGLAARFEIVAPTGTDEAFASAPTATWAPGLGFDYQLGDWSFGADVGGRFRDDVAFASTLIGSQIGAAVGAGYDILPDGWLGVGLEAFALFTLLRGTDRTLDPRTGEAREEPSPLHIPAEWLLSVRTAGLLDGRLRGRLGGGSFIPTGASLPVTVPAFRFVLGLDYAYD